MLIISNGNHSGGLFKQQNHPRTEIIIQIGANKPFIWHIKTWSTLLLIFFFILETKFLPAAKDQWICVLLLSTPFIASDICLESSLILNYNHISVIKQLLPLKNKNKLHVTRVVFTIKHLYSPLAVRQWNDTGLTVQIPGQFRTCNVPELWL